MEKGTIKRTDIELVYPSKVHRHYEPLFLDKIGEPVYSGDLVSFYIDGVIFPSSGTVSNLKNLRVDVFNTLLNKWEFYFIELKDGKL